MNNNSRFIKISLLYLFISVYILSLTLFIYFFYDYSTFIDYLTPLTQTEQQLFKLKNIYLTPQKFQILRVLGYLFWGILAIVGLVIYKNQSSFKQKIQYKFNLYTELFSYLKVFFQNLTLNQQYILLCFLLFLTCTRLFNLVYFPLTYDEIYIWEEFVRRGFWVIIAYYPIHGNHVLHTLIVNFFSFLGPIPALRLPSTIASLFLDLLILTWVFHKTQKLYLSIFAILILNLMYVNWIHSFLGRGYALAMTLCFAIWVFYEKNWIQKFFYELIVLQILALYTLPSTLFFLIPLWILTFQYDFKLLRANLFLTVFGAFIVYLPILIFLNPTNIFQGAYYQHVSYNEKMIFFNQIWQIPDFWNMPFWIGGIFICSLLGLILKKDFGARFWGIYSIIAVLIGLNTSFPAKAFMPLSFIIPYLLSQFTLKIKWFAGLVSIFAVPFLLFSNYKEFTTQFQVHFQAYRFAHAIYKQYPHHLKLRLNLSALDYTDLYYLNLKHVYHERGYDCSIDSLSNLQLILSKDFQNGTIIYQDQNVKIIQN